MGETSIEWTRGADGSPGHTVNPLRARRKSDLSKVGHYCEKISPGCTACYASRFQPRRGLPRFGGTHGRGLELVEPYLDVSKLEEVLRRRKPTTWFWCDMTDMFGSWVTNEQIAACFGVMAATPWHTHQVLTKRAERLAKWCNAPGTPLSVDRFRCIAEAGRIGEYFAPERTLPLPGWPGYSVTSKGRVLSDHRGERSELKPTPGELGHQRVTLYRNDQNEKHLVHRLVLSVFEKPQNRSVQACHIDGDPTNNAYWNLRWGSQEDNWSDSKRHGTSRRYSKLSAGQVNELRLLSRQGVSGEELGRRYGVSGTQARNIANGRQWAGEYRPAWPLPSVWLGVSVEDQKRADERIPFLLRAPAAVRFLSCEPLLGPVVLSPYLWGSVDEIPGTALNDGAPALPWRRGSISWVICGGESGPGARPFDLNWARDLRKQCAEAGVPFFMKQVGSRPEIERWRAEDFGSAFILKHGNKRITLEDRKGGDPAEWPEDLRVRQFPEVPRG